jgi:hypothetical protein
MLVSSFEQAPKEQRDAVNEARALFDCALQIDPNDASFRRPRAAYGAGRNWEAGRAIFEKAFGPALSVRTKLSPAVTVPQSGGFAAHSL